MDTKNLGKYLSLLIAIMAMVWLNLFPVAVRGQEPDPSFGDDIPASTESDKVSMSPASLEMLSIDLNDPAAIEILPLEDGDIAPIHENSCYEYLDNGGFEHDSDWSFSGNSDYDDTFIVRGAWSGYISTYGMGYNEGSYLYQEVTIPDTYSSITISYDTMAFAGDRGDAVYILIYDEEFDNLLDYGSISYTALDKWSNWKAMPEVWLGGRTINLVFYITHDNDRYYSGVSFDNMSMVICEDSYPTATPTSRPYYPTATPIPPTPTRYVPPTPVPPTPTRYVPPTPIPPTPTRYIPPTNANPLRSATNFDESPSQYIGNQPRYSKSELVCPAHRKSSCHWPRFCPGGECELGQRCECIVTCRPQRPGISRFTHRTLQCWQDHLRA